MSEQQYRVIADRDKGDDPQWGQVESGDRVWFSGPRDDVDRIERPVPTTDAPKTITLAINGTDYDIPAPVASWALATHMDAPHPPTREQIAETLHASTRPRSAT